eukprot:4806535-Pyramimonas_sp.AAC.1
MRLLRLRRYAESSTRTYANNGDPAPLEVFRKRLCYEASVYARVEDSWHCSVAALAGACQLSRAADCLGIAHDAARLFIAHTRD